MLDTLTDLSNLHALHLKLQEVNEELALGPKQIAIRKKRIAKAEAQVAAREAELKKHRTTADQKGMDLKTREAKVANLTAKLNQATSNKEYEAIKSQIAADEAASSVLEDESLEAMERVDVSIEALAADKATVAAAEKELAEYSKAFADRKEILDAEAIDLAEKIKASEVIVPAGQMREKYQRMAKSVGADAMSAVDGESCSGCFMQIPKQQQVRLNQGDIIFCGSCQRLLYKEAAPPIRR